jgi:hypothetical protein
MNDSYSFAYASLQKPLKELSDIIEKAYTPQISAFQQSFSQIYYDKFKELAETLNASYQKELMSSQQITALSNCLTEQQKLMLEKISATFQSAEFSSLFDGISIHDNYVSMPEDLIPDDFSYEEISTDSAKYDSLESSTVSKKLSIPDAKWIIASVLMPLLVYFLTYLTSLSPAPWQKQYHEEELQLQREENQLKREENQLKREENHIREEQLKVTIKVMEYLAFIYNSLEYAAENPALPASVLQEYGSFLSESESARPGSDSPASDAESSPHYADSMLSTSVDESGNSESPSKSE